MGDGLQHLLVLMLVAGCLGVIALKGYRTLAGKKGGSCACEGCPAGTTSERGANGSAAETGTEPVRPAEPKAFFIPSSSLSLRKATGGQAAEK